MLPTPLPAPIAALAIHAGLAEIRQALRHGSAVLCAPPGSGKTTGVPLALLDEGWLLGKKIIMLEPRRLAARAAATRMSALLGEQIGATVGYAIRFERLVSRQTRIEVVTEGILTRRIQADPELAGVGLVIFDEFHERSLHADLALALCLDLCAIRADLRLLVMSATLDAAPIAELLGGAPVISGQGKSFPVEIAYLDREATGTIVETTVRGINRILTEKEGDILAFLPGAGEIRRAYDLLRQSTGAPIVIAPLFGNLSREEQDQALLPDRRGRRRVVLATAIAETSLTIEGIVNVVDSGWSRLPRFRPASGLSGLDTVRVSRAAARQRAGRAGRLGPGFCLRLWTRHQHEGLVNFHPPEIRAADLASLVLELALWGVTDPHALRWLDPPPEPALAAARDLLRALAALDSHHRITALGRQLAALPLYPRLAAMLIAATTMGLGALAADLAALLGERDILAGERVARGADIGHRLETINRFRHGEVRELQERGVDVDLCRRVERVAAEYRRLLNIAQGKKEDADKAGLLLALAYPDRIAKLRAGSRERYLLSGGRGAVLPSHDPLAGTPWLVAAELDAGAREGRIFVAAPLAIDELRAARPDLFSWRESTAWDEAGERVTALRREMLGELVLREEPLSRPDPDATLTAMLTGIQRLGLACLPWSREARRLQARICCLRHWQPEGNWPATDDAALAADLAWIRPYLTGITRRDQLRQLDLTRILRDRLDWRQQQELDAAAPEKIEVASGSRILLDYRPGEVPVLAVRLQELFGQTETPTVCHGRVTVLLHLLSPAQRPIQVTSDLAGFWQRAYPEVKKELKGRYPKHVWPDDPLAARPTSRAQPRKR